MRLGFEFVPFPREIWEDKIDISGAALILLGWFLCDLKFGIKVSVYADRDILKGANKRPGVNLSRNSIKNARLELIDRGFIKAIQKGDGEWEYELLISPVVSKTDTKSDTNSSVLVSKIDTYNKEVDVDIDNFSLSAPSSQGDGPKTSKKKSKSNGSDPRHQPFKDLIFRCYRYQNDGEDPPWGPGDAKQLSSLLKETPKLDAEEFAYWLKYYAQSDNTNPADRPAKFLPKIHSYANGPLNGFGRPLEKKRVSS